MTDLESRCRTEVDDLHAFFEQWFNGEVDQSDEAMGRFTGVMAPGFHIVSPDGAMRDRAAIIRLVREGYGSGIVRGERTVRIWIENLVLRAASNHVAVVTYEEWQERGGEQTGRLSTAVLQNARETPNGLRWLHVHETWLGKDR